MRTWAHIGKLLVNFYAYLGQIFLEIRKIYTPAKLCTLMGHMMMIKMMIIMIIPIVIIKIMMMIMIFFVLMIILTNLFILIEDVYNSEEDYDIDDASNDHYYDNNSDVNCDSNDVIRIIITSKFIWKRVIFCWLLCLL